VLVEEGKCLREGFRAVFREHGRDDVNDDAELGLIRCGDIDEHILGVQSDFAVLRVDDWWHRKYAVLLVVDDWIYRRISDDVQVSCKMFFGLT